MVAIAKPTTTVLDFQTLRFHLKIRRFKVNTKDNTSLQYYFLGQIFDKIPRQTVKKHDKNPFLIYKHNFS